MDLGRYWDLARQFALSLYREIVNLLSDGGAQPERRENPRRGAPDPRRKNDGDSVSPRRASAPRRKDADGVPGSENGGGKASGTRNSGTLTARFLRHMAVGGRPCRERDGAVEIRYASDIVTGGITLYLFFSPEDDPYVSVRCYDVGTAFSEDIPRILGLCNQMNLEQPWAKFTLDGENDVVVSAEEMVDRQSVGWELEELCSRLVVGIEDAYPLFHSRENPPRRP